MNGELKERLKTLAARFAEMRGHLDLAGKRNRLEELEKEMGRPTFWDEGEKTQKAIQELKGIKEVLDPWEALDKELADLPELLDLGGGDEGLARELEAEFARAEERLDALELSAMLSQPEDEKNAIFSLQAGAGGTESCDWAEMLWRMYGRWCERRGFAVEVVNIGPGEEAGIRNLTALVKGRFAYGHLKAERGIHRLVRISPFDSAHRRHTSFASVDVFPEVDEEIKVEIEEKDLRIDTFRAGGHGGQHVNMTDSAVRITHLPTGIVVQCQNERSQHKNRATAMKVLRARLYQRQQDEQRKKTADHHKAQKEIGFGSQIRSYVFHPYTMVKDHRTGVSTGDVNRVMDGDLDPYITAFLKGGG
ncbi:MAG: peptide chain release factor 2 [Candidatus Aureabacteria bacterium]|nr:peptide chain release factor 2 [Candidatus Auribacterota bacterium]